MNKYFNKMHERFSSFWWGENGASALLLLLLFAFMLAPLLESGLARILSSMFFSLLLLSGVTTIWNKKLPRIGAALIALIILCIIWLRHLHPESRSLQAGSEILTLCYLVMLTCVIMRQVYRDGPVTAGRVQGAVAVYILIGLTWANIYRLLELKFPGSLCVLPSAVGTTAFERETQFTYFSFVTLTTLGYGDITPVHPAMRIFVIFEALIGQLFPATLLARLVSLQTASNRRNRES